MKRQMIGAVMGCLLAGITVSVDAAEPDDAARQKLEEAIYAEESVGNLEKATRLYRQIQEEAASQRPVAAEASWRLGRSLLKQGEKENGWQILMQTIDQYPEQVQARAKAREALVQAREDQGPPLVVISTPVAFDNAVDPDLGQIRARFDQRMSPGGYSWTGGGETFPQVAGNPSFTDGGRVAVLPVQLEPGKVYWVGINSPSHQNFKSVTGQGAVRHVILFATADEQGNPTEIPAEMVKSARGINEAALAWLSEENRMRVSPQQTQTSPAPEDKRKAEDLATQGWKLWGQDKLEDAESRFKQAVALDPTNANAWNGLGWAQLNQGKRMNAAHAFQKAEELDPEHAAALNGLGWIAKGQGLTEEALIYWRRAVEAAPGATAALSGLASTHAERGEWEEATMYYRQWLQHEPQNQEAQQGLKQAEANLLK